MSCRIQRLWKAIVVVILAYGFGMLVSFCQTVRYARKVKSWLSREAGLQDLHIAEMAIDVKTRFNELDARHGGRYGGYVDLFATLEDFEGINYPRGCVRVYVDGDGIYNVFEEIHITPFGTVYTFDPKTRNQGDMRLGVRVWSSLYGLPKTWVPRCFIKGAPLGAAGPS